MVRSRISQDVDYLRYRELEQERELKSLKRDVRQLRVQRKPLSWWKTLLLSVPVLMIVVFALETEIEIEQFAITRDGLIVVSIVLALLVGVYVYARRK